MYHTNENIHEYFACSSFYKTYQTAPLEGWKVVWYDEVNKEIIIRERNLKINKILNDICTNR